MTKNIKKKSVRLSKNIFPISYDLRIKPDLESFTFSGNETIKLKINKDTKSITLHSKDIDIKTAKIANNKNEQFSTKITYNKESETATIYFRENINGESKLYLNFIGIINDNLRGFYKSKYILNGEEKYLATTQFEATDARRAFPCFDEPDQKAKFKISFIIADKYNAISNTLINDIKEHESGFKIISFDETPKMSTYLLAFIIGEFEHIEGYTTTNNNIKTKVRVFTTKGKIHQAKFALSVAIKSLEFYNEYFDIPYPLNTLDLIAIPDFESAAMENWGAITFRETAILVDEENTPLSNKQWVAIVIAHEIAHQWFGNLVTMSWWTDLWLNEGFASYMENFCIDKLFPNWHIWDLYLSDRYAMALRLDSLSNSHPIEIEVNHPDEINEIFDMVSYAKGSAIIRQLAEYIGEENFRNGLQLYLKKHSYKNTRTKDLWVSFEKVSKLKISNMMSKWTRLTGYPLVSVRVNNDTTTFTQERFFSSRVSKTKKEKSIIWPIPIQYNQTKVLFDKKSINIKDNTITKINKDEKSFIRVFYDDVILEKIGQEIKQNKLEVKDRLGIIRDMFVLAEGGYITTDKVLAFTLNFINEIEYIVWVEITNGINKINNLFSKEIYIEKYRKYVNELYLPIFSKVTFTKKENDKHADILLRNLVIKQLSYYKNKKVINGAILLFKDKNKIDIDIKSSVYSIIANNGGEKEWKIFYNLYKEQELHEEKERLGYALTFFKNKNLIEKTLNFILSDEVKDQDTPHMLVMVWQNKDARTQTWNFIKKNWKVILKKYGQGGHFLSRMLSPIGLYKTKKDLLLFKDFFNKNEAPGATRSLEQAYEKIEGNIAWIRDDLKIIEKWLNKNY